MSRRHTRASASLFWRRRTWPRPADGWGGRSLQGTAARAPGIDDTLKLSGWAARANAPRPLDKQ
eukprot:scaffold21332_cov57-Phaeocystis_antarctica.AAC.1